VDEWQVEVSEDGPRWFSVRCILRFAERSPATFEERITLWRAADFDQALSLAEAEAREYADLFGDCAYAGLAQAYALVEAPGHGTEVFSLMRDSALEPEAYLTRFFDTGRERQAQHHPS
jgi:hypothetical protein